MPPIRRYLRISPYTVLLVNIYLDNPSLAQSWLLHPAHPVLPRIIQSIKPLILPKIREEEDRAAKKKGAKKKKSVKDTVIEQDFEVSIFLTDVGATHCLLKRQKIFKDKEPIKSNSNKLLGSHASGGEVGNAIEVDDTMPTLNEEEDEIATNALSLADIPAAPPLEAEAESSDDDDDFESMNPSKRRRRDSDSLFVDDEDDVPSPKRSRLHEEDLDGLNGGEDDDKKKMAMDVVYDGFNIHNKALCLIVTRRAVSGRKITAGQVMMEEWMATQVPIDDVE